MNNLPINHPLLQLARQCADTLFSPLGGLLAAATAVFLFGCAYTVDQAEQVVITQFGRPVGQPINAAEPGAGLHFKLPFVQTANRFEKRILQWDGPPNEMTTRDKLYIVVDTFARWRIADPLKYFESLRDERSAMSRLDDIIGSETRNVVARHDLIEVVRSDKSRQPEQDAALADSGTTVGTLPPDMKASSSASSSDGGGGSAGSYCGCCCGRDIGSATQAQNTCLSLSGNC